MSEERETDVNMIANVRRLTGLSEEDVTDDLILAMEGTAEQRAGRIILYRKYQHEEQSR